MTKNKFRKIVETNNYHKAANASSFTKHFYFYSQQSKLNLLQQKQPKTSLKAHFFKNGEQENFAARVTCFELN
jgi:hypothetical protein